MNDRTLSNSDCVLYVASCDAYKDIWPGFFYCLGRHWPDNPFPVYLGTNRATPDIAGVTSLQATDESWSSCVRQHLKALSANYVLFMLDDFFLRRRVDTGWVLDALAFTKQQDAAAVRLIARPPPEIGSRNYPFIGYTASISPQRVCLQGAIWRRQDLLQLLRDEESIWQFERSAPSRSAGISGIFCAASRDILPYRGILFHHVIEKGRWIPSEYLRCATLGVPCRDSHRPWLPWLDFALLTIAEVINRIISAIIPNRSDVTRKWLSTVLPRCFLELYRRLRHYDR